MLRNGRPAGSGAEEMGGSHDDEDSGPLKPPRQWDIGAVCEALIDHCLRLGSRDNMSVVIVLLDPALLPKSA